MIDDAERLRRLRKYSSAAGRAAGSLRRIAEEKFADDDQSALGLTAAADLLGFIVLAMAVPAPDSEFEVDLRLGTCLGHMRPEPCSTCAAYIAAGL